jgi:hypothetical protein
LNPSVLTGPAHGTATVDTAGNIIYVPNPNFNGTDSFTYVVCDNGIPAPSLCDTAVVYITVTPVNDPPVAMNDTVTILEDSTAIIIVRSNDHDVDGDSTIGNPSILTGPSHGSASVDSTGAVTYVPNPNFNGTDSFTYVICDNGIPAPSLCDTAVVYITVTTVNDPPVAMNDSAIIREDSTAIVVVLANDHDPDGDSTLGSPSVLTGPSHGTATVDTAGNIVYVPNPNYNGTDSFTYVLCDNGIPAPTHCDTATVFIIITPVRKKKI